MLSRAALCGLLGIILAGCAGKPPAVLPPVRDGLLRDAVAPRPESAQARSTSVSAPEDSDSDPGTAAGAPVSSLPVASAAAVPDDAPPPASEGRQETVERQPAGVTPLVRDVELPAARESPAGRESQAVRELLASARAAGEARQYGRAAAALERALKVEPRNPGLWHRLAMVRFRQGRHAEAVALALRSRSLTSGDPDLDSRNWRLTAAARHRMGDEEGAREALRRAGDQ